MVIVKVKGGLGNQLFQYAVGRHLAEIHKSVLKLDISLYENYELHAYSLRPFNIQENIASTNEVSELTKRSIVERAAAKIGLIPTKPARTYIQERTTSFCPEILDLPDNVYLDGYWQSEKYFIDIAEIIRREFTVKHPQEGKDKELAGYMKSCESVSLHIRRGSYLLPRYNAVHGTCSLDYYDRAVKHITETVKEPRFFVFSDDPQWTVDNLQLPYHTTYITHNGADKDYEDLRLMGLCHHHIIANSTFSWWGAWLGRKHGQIVVAPQQWFAQRAVDVESRFPPDWQVL